MNPAVCPLSLERRKRECSPSDVRRPRVRFVLGVPGLCYRPIRPLSWELPEARPAFAAPSFSQVRGQCPSS